MFLHGAPLSFGWGSSLSYGLLHVYRTWSTYLWPSRFQQHTQSLITMETYKQMHSCISHVPYREPDLTTTTTLPKLSSSFWIWEKNINRNIQMEISSVARAIWKSLPATSHIHFPFLPAAALHLRELQLPRSFVNCLPGEFIQWEALERERRGEGRVLIPHLFCLGQYLLSGRGPSRTHEPFSPQPARAALLRVS